MQYIKLMRVKHWIKNLLIFLPVIFSGKLDIEINNIFQLILGFLVFSLTSSVVYILNDIVDAPQDRKHEQKKNRPIASGRVKSKQAVILIIFLLIAILWLICYLNKFYSYYFIICLVFYLLINLAYSMKLKNFPIIDITIIVLGYIIRVVYGGILVSVEISKWLYLTVISMALFLILGKRRNENIKYNGNISTRTVLSFYTLDFLDISMYTCLGLTNVFYTLWATNINTLKNLGNNMIILTIPLVILICVKYVLNIEKGTSGDPTEVLLNDRWLIFLVTIYMVFILYLYI